MEQDPYAALRADVAEHIPMATAQPLSLAQMLFSFEGRMRRGKYWACSIGAWLAVMLTMVIIGVVIESVGRGHESIAGPIFAVFSFLLFLPWCWSSFALQVKRLHDRGKSGWWMLLGLVPIVNLWVVIEVGFWPGTPGPNDYGPPPR